MVLTSVLIGLAFFVALLALVGGAYREGSRERQEHIHEAGPDGTECLLCHAQLPHLGTADEAVAEIERRIASDRRDVTAAVARHSAQPQS